MPWPRLAQCRRSCSLSQNSVIDTAGLQNRIILLLHPPQEINTGESGEKISYLPFPLLFQARGRHSWSSTQLEHCWWQAKSFQLSGWVISMLIPSPRLPRFSSYNFYKRWGTTFKRLSNDLCTSLTSNGMLFPSWNTPTAGVWSGLGWEQRHWWWLSTLTLVTLGRVAHRNPCPVQASSHIAIGDQAQSTEVAGATRATSSALTQHTVYKTAEECRREENSAHV